jgi:hypothetical protein
MSDLFRKLRCGAGKVAFEADKQARLFRVQGEQNQLKHQLEVSFTRIGEIAYQQYQDKVCETDTYLSYISEVSKLLDAINEKRQEAVQIQAEIYKPEVETNLEKRGLSGSELEIESLEYIEPIGEVHNDVRAETVQDITGTQMPAKPESTQTNSLNRKSCSSCHQAIPEHAKFCPKCGKRTE